jgi:AAA+ ATPase superfamily predicted ATPase
MLKNILIGRQAEQEILERKYASFKSEFVAIYGRRRVGKTFLVRQVFEQRFSFYLTGAANEPKKQQLALFRDSMMAYSSDKEDIPLMPDDWFDAFRQLISLLKKLPKDQKKVIFLDEMPWLATKKSGFLSALEYFWNSWASARNDILLIVCGSAASWMINKLLKNKGGLYNRVTARIKVAPFTLLETEQFLKHRRANYSRYQTVLTYMVLGGIPFYLDQIEPDRSSMQNINRLCFTPGAIMKYEYDSLFASLFKNAEKHVSIIEALATKGKGIKRSEILKLSGLKEGGTFTRILRELEESSFIRKYKPFDKKKRDSLYQLIDPYSLFYLRFIKGSDENDEDFWKDLNDTPRYYNWSGYAFEIVCLHHIPQIKKALGIAGVSTSVASWQNQDAQIDLLIDRKDQIINLCEMKFMIEPFMIDKSYQMKLLRKKGAFRQATGTKKAIWLTMISSYGTTNGIHSDVLQHDLTMDVLFE